MSRTYAAEAEPHRDLVRLSSNVQRGADVRSLESAGERRLEARGISAERLGRDGILTPDEFDALITAARYLGALESTLARRDERGRLILSVGAQQMIRYPGRRTLAQLERARERMEALEAERKRRAKRPQRPTAGGGVSGMTAAQRSDARDRAVAAMSLALRNRSAVHYTQGSRRWDGIRLGLRSASGQFPRYADCSSLTTWALWNALTGAAGSAIVADVVNGQGWRAGYTGTQLTHGERVSELMPGDLVLYGRGWPGSHVAMYAGNGMVISHGSESGPHYLRVRYRGDVLAYRRYI